MSKSTSGAVAEPRPLALTILGGVRHSGRVGLGPRLGLVSLIGGMDLDLTDAEVPAGGVTIVKVSLLGGVSLVVPESVRVEVGGFVLLGGKDVERRPHPDPAAPVIRVRAFGLIGGVRVRVA
jgi:hypothetical protein